MKKLVLLFILVILSFLLVFAISQKQLESSDSSKLAVSTSIYPMYFLASEIGGDKVNVVNITPAGAEPHDYELTPSDLIRIENRKLLVLNGGIEPWAEKVKSNLYGKNVKIVKASTGLDTTDPHIWLSIASYKLEANNILQALQELDPNNALYYASNKINLEKKLDELSREYKDGLRSCAGRSFVTAHEAFSYLAKDYNLKQVAIEGLSADEEPSLAKLAQVANFARDNNIKYIFFESLVSPKFSETIANEVGAETLILDPIEGISQEDLEKGVNYLTLMSNNLQNLKIALACK